MPEPEEKVVDNNEEPTAEDKTLEEMDKIISGTDETAPVTEEAEGEIAGDSADGEVADIPLEEGADGLSEEWVEAGQAAGLGDEVIAELADTNPAVLKALSTFRRRSMEQPAPVVEKEEDKLEVEEYKPLEHVSPIDIDFKDDKVKQLFSGVVDNQNTLIDNLNTVSQELHEAKVASLSAKKANDGEFDAFVDNYFDSKVKTSPHFGLSKALTGEQLTTRQSVFAMAKLLPGKDWTAKLDKAAVGWNAMSGRSETEAKIAEKLGRHKKKFVARPGGQKAGKDSRTASEKGLAEFDKIFTEYGVGVE